MVSASNTICDGNYVVLQRKDYKKLHLLSEKSSSLFMGKDKVDISIIFGKLIGSTFKMVPLKGVNRQFTLISCSNSDIGVPASKELLKDLSCGLDNRSICDDGSSQVLTSNSIEELRESGTAPKAIMKQLLENSKTFQIKTGYSQEKYIKKKEKKYFEYITILKPNIRLLAEIFYNRDMPKMIGIRIDTLSQLVTALNFQPDGCYLLVENGFNGIVAATLLNSLCGSGTLIHVTPGNQNQKQAVLSMNFSSSHLSQLVTIRLSTMLELLKSRMSPEEPESCDKVPLQDEDLDCKNQNEQQQNKINPEDRKRKYSNMESSCQETLLKKPRWALEANTAVDILLKKVDGLVVACKDFPSNIVNLFLEYLLPSRPFIIYSLYQEPLVSLYLQLKQRLDIANLKITDSWLRPYQVLPDRTHPAVTVSSSSGFLLTGIKVVNS